MAALMLQENNTTVCRGHDGARKEFGGVSSLKLRRWKRQEDQLYRRLFAREVTPLSNRSTKEWLVETVPEALCRAGLTF